MATLVADALEILTDDGTGTPVSTAGVPAIGLASDGHFYLVTDRPTITTMSGDTSQTTWYQGILTRDYGNWTLSRNIDFVEAGAFESVSDFNVGIKNTGDFRAALVANGIYLGRRRVKYYRLTSTNGTAWTAELRWTGVVDDQPFNERTYSLRCVSVAKDIFGTLPTVPVNDSTFPSSPEDSRGKMVPIALGRVGYSPLVNIKKSGAKTVLMNIDGTDYTFAACSLVTGSFVRLKTNGVAFEFGDTRLLGKYASVLNGTAQTLMIRYVYETDTDFAPDYYTDIVLAEPLAGFTSDNQWDLGATTSDKQAWFFEVLDLSPTPIASTNPIMEFIRQSNNQPTLSRYLSDSKAYEDVSYIKILGSDSNIDRTGHPGFSIVAKALTQSGDLVNYYGIVPSDIQVVSQTTFTGLPAVGSSLPLLKDLSDDASSKYTLNAAMANLTAAFAVDVYLPESLQRMDFDELYTLIDLGQLRNSVTGTVILKISVDCFDIYGRTIHTSISNQDLFNGSIATTETPQLQLPKNYFGIESNALQDATFYTQKSDYNIGDAISGSKNFGMYQKIRLSFSLSKPGAMDYTLNLYEIGLVAKRTIGVSSEPLYTALKGELFGSTMDGRVSATDYPESVSRALEYLMRTFDPKVEIDTTSFDRAHVNRGLWLIGRTLTEKKASLEYYQSLMAQAFLLGTMTPAGKVQINAWLQNTTPLIAFSESNILQGSLGDVTLTPVRRMYNDIRIKYDKNPGSGGFNKQIAITNIDQASFPGPSESSDPGATLGTFSVTPSWISPETRMIFFTDNPHGLTASSVVSLSGNSSGYDFTPTPVLSIVDDNQFIVLLNTVLIGAASTSGTLKVHDTSRLKWKDYVAGVDNYSTAKDLWDQCHSSFLVTKAINKLPDELGQCEWFFDPYATDPNGSLLWPDLNVGDMHAAVGFATGLANWTAWQKKQVTFETIDNATFSAIQHGQCVSFADSKLTGGTALTGWVHEKTQLPRTDKLPGRFRWGLTLYPEALSTYPPPSIIEEHGATDIIDEHGATNIIEEHGA